MGNSMERVCMKKIRTFEEVRINVDGGYAEVHIAETSDNVFNITIKEGVDKKIRIGILDEHGINYMFFEDIVDIVKKYNSGELINMALITMAFNKAAGETKQGHEITAKDIIEILKR